VPSITEWFFDLDWQNGNAGKSSPSFRGSDKPSSNHSAPSFRSSPNSHF
jgi:hypothetical protein